MITSIYDDKDTAPRRPRRWLLLAPAVLAAVVSAAAGAVTLALAAAIAYVAFYDAPFWDHWQHLAPIASIDALLARNNEHPMTVNRIFFWLDDVLFDSSARFLQAITLAAVAIQTAAIAALRPRGMGVLGLIGVSGFAAACAFSAFGFEILIWPFELSFAMAFAMAAAAFAALAAYAGSGSAIALGVSLAATIVSCLSLANGVLAPTLLVPMALLLRRPMAALGFAAVAIIAWPWQLGSPGGPGVNLDIARIGEMAVHLLTQLGAPVGFSAGYLNHFGLLLHAEPSARLVGAGVAVLSAIVLAHILTRRRSDPTALAIAGLILFALASALLTTLGRYDMGAAQAMSSRYNSAISLLYGGLLVGVLGLWFDLPSLPRLVLAWASPAFAASALALSATGAPLLYDLTGRHREALVGVTALVSGAPDASAISKLAFEPGFARFETENMRARESWMFDAAAARRMGGALTDQERAAPPCAGTEAPWGIAQPDAEGGFARADGAFTARDVSARARHVLIVRYDGVIVGYGRVPRRPSDLDPRSRPQGRAVDWQGHVLGLEGQPFQAYLSDDEAVRCSLGTGAQR